MLPAAQMLVTVALGSVVGSTCMVSDGRIEGIPGEMWHKDEQK